MEKLPWATITMVVFLSTLTNAASLNSLGYTTEKYDETPGIYYENKGVAVLYNIAWKNIAHVNLNKTGNETATVRQYVHHVEMLCQMTVARPS
jgi:hypothetical protein